MDIFEILESEVRTYCRTWDTVFDRASGSTLYSEDGRDYLDFFSGAGALNYGHNNPDLLRPLVEYLLSGAIVHSLDMKTVAKRRFLETFHELILKPRNYDYKVMFPGPTGTNSVEAALKLARKVTGTAPYPQLYECIPRDDSWIPGSDGQFHEAGGRRGSARRTHPACPMTASLTARRRTFCGSAMPWRTAARASTNPPPSSSKPSRERAGSGRPAPPGSRGLAELCRQHGILLIVDDVQAGCGRTGTFFSFEDAGITPDIVCLSKSISGFGLPLSLTLFKPEHDIWKPGEHNGTFRGHNPAFVTGTAALERYWGDRTLEAKVAGLASQLHEGLTRIAAGTEGARVRGRGLLAGIYYPDHQMAGKIAAESFARGLLVETSGPEGEVIKTMPALTIDAEELSRGLDILADAAESVAGGKVAVKSIA